MNYQMMEALARDRQHELLREAERERRARAVSDGRPAWYARLRTQIGAILRERRPIQINEPQVEL